jgi:hypothetical protein
MGNEEREERYGKLSDSATVQGTGCYADFRKETSTMNRRAIFGVVICIPMAALALLAGNHGEKGESNKALG